MEYATIIVRFVYFITGTVDKESWEGCHGRGIFFINYIPYAQGIEGVSEPLDHCAMHARHPTACVVSGLFSFVRAVVAHVFGARR